MRESLFWEMARKNSLECIFITAILKIKAGTTFKFQLI